MVAVSMVTEVFVEPAALLAIIRKAVAPLSAAPD